MEEKTFECFIEVTDKNFINYITNKTYENSKLITKIIFEMNYELSEDEIMDLNTL